jgi:Signal transduction histidine kinase
MYVEWLSDHRNITNKEKITQQTLHCVDESITMVREIARNLCPYLLEQFGLVYALKDYAERINSRRNLTIVVHDQSKARLPLDMELSLYRVLMECISNSIKHSGATRIEIKFKTSPSSLKIVYSDNGSGFDIDKTLKEAKGMGLINMKQRISLIGGDFQLQSDKSGTKITINITNLLWGK